LWQKLSKKLEEDHKKEFVSRSYISEGISCKFCGSSKIIKYGKANNKQVYFCKSCARKFVPNGGFEGMKYDPRIVTTTRDLYFKDVSLRNRGTTRSIAIAMTSTTALVYRWISSTLRSSKPM
jgi:transposase-like protein